MSDERVSGLSDRELLCRLNVLTRQERSTTLEILHHLNEVETRRLHITQGFSSMFDYCTRSLRYSASAAARLIRTARCLCRFPAVEPLLENREVGLSTVALIAGIVKDDNSGELLDRVRNKSQREVEAIVAEYTAPVKLRDRVRPVRVRVSSKPTPESRSNHTSTSDYCRSGSSLSLPLDDPNPPAAVEKKLFIQFLADEAFMEKYEEVRTVPANATFEDIFAALMGEFIDRHSPAKRAARRKKRAGSKKTSTGQSRHVPARIGDEIFTRDGGRCTYVGQRGCAAVRGSIYRSTTCGRSHGEVLIIPRICVCCAPTTIDLRPTGCWALTR